MKYYIEIFNKEENFGCDKYIKTSLTPDQIVKVFHEHPVCCFELTPEASLALGLEGLDFENQDYFLVAAREYVGEVYEYLGERLYPPPLLLGDIFNSVLVRPITK